MSCKEKTIEIVSLEDSPQGDVIHFSIGYRSISHNVLRTLGLVTENETYPFDHMISRLNVVQHCVDTDFVFLLNPDNYETAQTKTVHYRRNHDIPTSNLWSDAVLISHDVICFNTYYQNHAAEWLPSRIMQIPKPLKFPEDTNAYHLAMKLPYETLNEMPERVERWHKMMHSSNPKRYLYIHPVISETEFNHHKYTLVRECIEFQEWISKRTCRIRGCFIFVIRTVLTSPITDHIPHVLPSLVDHVYSGKYWKHMGDVDPGTDCDIFCLYANRDIVDAGDFFGNTSIIETDTLIKGIL